MLIGVNLRNEVMWRSIIQKVANKLSPWKHKLLSLAERLCLICDDDISFYLSFYEVVKVVVKKIISLQVTSCSCGEKEGERRKYTRYV